jgi:hypothetical protein
MIFNGCFNNLQRRDFIALSDCERVGGVLEALRQGLGPFILWAYKCVYTAKGYVTEIDTTLSTISRPGVPDAAWSEETELLGSLDTHARLNLVWRRWNEVFQEELGHNGRSYVSEMMSARLSRLPGSRRSAAICCASTLRC